MTARGAVEPVAGLDRARPAMTDVGNDDLPRGDGTHADRRRTSRCASALRRVSIQARDQKGRFESQREMKQGQASGAEGGPREWRVEGDRVEERDAHTTGRADTTKAGAIAPAVGAPSDVFATSVVVRRAV